MILIAIYRCGRQTQRGSHLPKGKQLVLNQLGLPNCKACEH